MSKYLGAVDRFGLMVAGMAHDVGHPGRNSHFLMESGHELAIRYNDQSPLENMHAAKLFEIVRQPNTAILSDLQEVQYREVRHLCIESILSTDYWHHFNIVKELQTLYDMNT